MCVHQFTLQNWHGYNTVRWILGIFGKIRLKPHTVEVGILPCLRHPTHLVVGPANFYEIPSRNSLVPWNHRPIKVLLVNTDKPKALNLGILVGCLRLNKLMFEIVVKLSYEHTQYVWNIRPCDTVFSPCWQCFDEKFCSVKMPQKFFLKRGVTHCYYIN